MSCPGCIGDVLRPKTKKEYVTVDRGIPGIYIPEKNDKPTVLELMRKDGSTYKQNINGWTLMGPAHYEALLRKAGLFKEPLKIPTEEKPKKD